MTWFFLQVRKQTEKAAKKASMEKDTSKLKAQYPTVDKRVLSASVGADIRNKARDSHMAASPVHRPTLINREKH